MKPFIGVTQSKGLGGFIQNIAIRFCLRLSGAKTINLNIKKPRYDIPIDGLVLTGGTDLYPGLYRSLEIKQGYNYDHARDQLELKWLEISKKKCLPILCICRGAQLLNVFEGGTLYTDISKIFEDARYPNTFFSKVFFRKKINIKENSILKDIVKNDNMDVNSIHSQSINKLGKKLKVSAMEDNGVVQAIEKDNRRFILGLQFHPEFLFYKVEIRKIFKRFVKACLNNT